MAYLPIEVGWCPSTGRGSLGCGVDGPRRKRLANARNGPGEALSLESGDMGEDDKASYDDLPPRLPPEPIEYHRRRPDGRAAAHGHDQEPLSALGHVVAVADGEVAAHRGGEELLGE